MIKRLSILLLTVALLLSFAACDITKKDQKPDRTTSDATTTASPDDGTTTASPNDGTTTPGGNAATDDAPDAPTKTDPTTGTDATVDPDQAGEDVDDGGNTNGVTLESVQANPTLALLIAASQTMVKLNTSVPTPDILATMQDFLQNGTASLSFQNATVFETLGLEQVSLLNATYYNTQDERAFEFAATSKTGEKTSVLLYSNRDILILAADLLSEESDFTYSVKTADLSNAEWIDAFLVKLNDAGLALPTESIQEILDLCDRLTADDTSRVPSLEGMDFSWITSALNGLAPEVESVWVGDDLVLEYYQVSYTLTPEKLKTLIGEVFEQFEITDEMAEMICKVLEIETVTGAELRVALEQILSDQIDQVGRQFEIEATARALISPEDGDLDEVIAHFSMKNLETAQTVSVSLAYELEELPNRLTLRAAVSTPDGAASREITVASYEKDGTYSYYLTLVEPNGNMTQEHCARLKYEQSTGAFTLTLTLGDKESAQIAAEITEEIIITGSLKLENGVVTGIVDRIKLANRGVSLINVGLHLTVTPEITEVFKPEDPVDIGSLTVEELREILDFFAPQAEDQKAE